MSIETQEFAPEGKDRRRPGEAPPGATPKLRRAVPRVVTTDAEGEPIPPRTVPGHEDAVRKKMTWGDFGKALQEKYIKDQTPPARLVGMTRGGWMPDKRSVGVADQYRVPSQVMGIAGQAAGDRQAALEERVRVERQKTLEADPFLRKAIRLEEISASGSAREEQAHASSVAGAKQRQTELLRGLQEKRVDPHRIFHNQNAGQKILMFLSLAIGGKQSVDMLLHLLDNDVRAQEADAENMRAGVAEQGNALTALRAVHQDRMKARQELLAAELLTLSHEAERRAKLLEGTAQAGLAREVAAQIKEAYADRMTEYSKLVGGRAVREGHEKYRPPQPIYSGGVPPGKGNRLEKIRSAVDKEARKFAEVYRKEGGLAKEVLLGDAVEFAKDVLKSTSGKGFDSALLRYSTQEYYANPTLLNRLMDAAIGADRRFGERYARRQFALMKAESGMTVTDKERLARMQSAPLDSQTMTDQLREWQGEHNALVNNIAAEAGIHGAARYFKMQSDLDRGLAPLVDISPANIPDTPVVLPEE